MNNYSKERFDQIWSDATTRKSSKKRCNYNDYEEFKQRLHEIGIYNKDSDLANLLKV